MVLHYKNGVGIFEGSWDLPRSYQDLEVFGLERKHLHAERESGGAKSGEESAQRGRNRAPCTRSARTDRLHDLLHPREEAARGPDGARHQRGRRGDHRGREAIREDRPDRGPERHSLTLQFVDGQAGEQLRIEVGRLLRARRKTTYRLPVRQWSPPAEMRFGRRPT